MAKSLRSKWKRKMRAVKRDRYGEKELKRLNDMLIKAGDIQFLPEIKEEKKDEENIMSIDGEAKETKTSDVDLMSGPPRSRLDKSRSLTKTTITAEQVDLTKECEVEKMTVDGERIFRKKTMRDQYGNYPDWMNKRKIRTQQKKNKRLKKRAKSLKRK